MRIIHTADWHLCDKLGRIDRTRDLEVRVERVAALCEEHAADVLLIAGDLFSEQASVDEMTQAFKHIRQAFAPFFARGGTVLTITGNHDRDTRINLVREGMQLAAPSPASGGGKLYPGRFYLINGLTFGTLESQPGDAVQFVFVPYPFPSRYHLDAGAYKSKEEETRLLHGKVADWLRSVSTKLGFDTSLPTVLAAHLHVRGSEMHTLYRMSDREDVMFDYADLNPMWAYVALGHIHKPQALGAPHVRYPGSLDRLDFGETHDEHGVLLVDIQGAATVEPQRLPIPATPFYRIELTDPEAEVNTLAERYPDLASAVVQATLSPPRAGTSRDEIVRQLRKACPRLRQHFWTDAAAPAARVEGLNPRMGFAATVREYLDKHESLKQDPDREAILALAEAFLKVMSPG